MTTLTFNLGERVTILPYSNGKGPEGLVVARAENIDGTVSYLVSRLVSTGAEVSRQWLSPYEIAKMEQPQ